MISASSRARPAPSPSGFSPHALATGHIGLIAALFAMLVLGGGSSQAPVMQVSSQVLGILLLASPLIHTRFGDLFRADRAQTVLLLALAALFAAQLFPLPTHWWIEFPGRALFAVGDRLVFGLPQPRPWSLDPAETRAAALFLVPALAIWLRARTTPAFVDRWLLAWFAFLATSLLVALAQVASEPGALRLYTNGHNDLPVGLFANRNHQAAAMACGLPFAAALHRRLRAGQGQGQGQRLLFPVLALAFTVGGLLTASRAGALLLLPALAGSILIAYAGTPALAWLKGRRGLLWLALALAVVVVALVTLWALRPGGALGAVFSRTLLDGDARTRYWSATWLAIQTFAPWGTGLGTFRRAFEVIEPGYVLAPLYVNHAHCDYLEVLMESGIAGGALVLAFLGWLGWRLRAVRRLGLDAAPMAHAAGLVIVLLLLHSTCDYPLRTVALSVCFAVSFALLALPLPHRSPALAPLRSTPA